jgi:hypothetical protein
MQLRGEEFMENFSQKTPERKRPLGRHMYTVDKRIL